MAARGRRSASAIVIGLILVAAGVLAAGASAAPLLSMKQPAPGSTTNSTPIFSGSTDDTADPVQVLLYKGETAGGKPQETLESALPSEGAWSVQASGGLSLNSGTYTAVAEQTESLLLGLGETSSTPPVTFAVDTEPPEVTLESPTKQSNDTTPSFSGSASEAGEVVVHIFLGTEQVATATATTNGGSWSSGAASPALPIGKHSFTAYATEVSSLGNGEGRSTPEASFEVNTSSPEVTLKPPATPSGNQTPSFSGAANEAGKVVVHILQGTEQVATASATVSGGKWSSGPASPALPAGKHSFTVYASEQSAYGDEPGKSAEFAFEVNTNTPEVTLDQPATPSRDQTPSFSGNASEAGEVVVHILRGGQQVATASTTTGGGSWSSGAASPALPIGKHSFTAYATEVSSLGNGEGRSTPEASFEVNTEPPAVTLNPPAKVTNHRAPSFSGNTSEAGQVVVHIFLGTEEVAKATATASAGSWSSGPASPELPAGKHSFTAYAGEVSSLGNGEGRSSPEASFEVNTNPPELTISPPPSPSNDRTPSFSGSASEAGKVVVHIMLGTEQVATAKATASNGKWSSAPASPELPAGQHSFTAFATEQSALENEPGSTGNVSFEVDTNPPVVTLSPPPTPSKDQTPSFSGTASEAGKVIVHIFEAGHEVAKANATTGGGSWSSGAASPALAKGKHSFTAYATEQSSLENGEGRSVGEVSFEVNTEPPGVTMTAPAKVTGSRTPSFSGSASEAGEVVVHIMKGSEQVATATATTSGGSWSSGAASPALAKGKHSFTAYATELSALENGEGRSGEATFEVNTDPPAVTLNTPATPSNQTKPSFVGTASEAGEVVVHILEAGHQVAEATATTSGGSWSSGAASPALATGKHSFTAYASEVSALGNGEGRSTPEATFEVNTEPPTVTLIQPTTPSNNQKPSFSGSASEAGEVVVHILEAGHEIAKATATTSGGSWTSGAATPTLPKGKNTFTAYASEVSALGNGEGRSTPEATFEVNTEPPKVTLTQPVTPSNNQKPSFSGTASEAGEVVVKVFLGSEKVAEATATTTSGGNWSSGAATPELPKGEHTFTVQASEKSALGNATGESAKLPFVVNTEPPKLTLEQPPKLSNNTTPTFSGTTSEAGEVVVKVFLGSTEVAKATATTTGGKWTSGSASPALPKGTNNFTVQATERSALGNADGQSAILTFEVNTEPPKVTLKSPPLASNEKSPAFSGTTSEAGQVTVRVYSGTTAPEAGTPVAKLEVKASVAGEWNAGRVASGLSDGKYTSVASEPSALGNAAGRSSETTFEVNTNAPIVTITQPKSPSNVTEPTFTGTVSAPESEKKQVTVLVYAGSTPGGSLVATTAASVKAGSWTSGKVSLSRGNNIYTAVASTPSALGNNTGESAPVTFRVDTAAPEVTLNQPKSPSNQTTPTFSGKTTESSLVTVFVYKGSTPEGTPVATVKDKETSGVWEAGPLARALEDGRYTAIATQPSSIAGNAAGSSQPVSFTVNTQTPVVSLSALPTPSPNRSPSFAGTSTESEPVKVAIYKGASPAGAPVAEGEGEVSNGAWVTGRLEQPLDFGEYTAVATQRSSIGNPNGSSAPFTFVVAQIPPTATTEASSDVARSSAAFYASVNPHGGSVTDCHFEYGPTTSYGTQVECGFVAELSVFPAASVGAVAVFARVYGLHPSTTYHVRIVAVGEGGTGVGSDSTFKTLEPITFPGATTSTPVAVGSKAPTGGTAGFFAAQLIPRGRGAKIGELLKNGFFKQRFRAPQAGTAVVKWYYQPPRIHSGAKQAARPPILVASGKVSFHAPGTATLKIRLTAAGRRLLKRSRRVRLKSTCSFAPTSGRATVASEAFSLRR